MRSLLGRLAYWWRSKVVTWKLAHGHNYCATCGKLRRPRFVKEWLLHPEEPPLFGRLVCPWCGESTSIFPTQLTERAVKNLGYQGFDDYARKVIVPRMEREKTLA